MPGSSASSSPVMCSARAIRGIIALGFLAAGPWDESSQRDIRDDTVDKVIAQNLDRDDMLTTVMSTFMSTTVHCARCHDHKFDPIGQAEYYGLQAVFAGVDRADRPYDADPAVRSRRLALARRKAELQGGAAAAAKLLRDPAIAAEVAAWERSLAKATAVWKVLDAQVVVSARGARVSRLPDGSVLFGGPRPERDTYTFEAVTGLPAVSAVRLEVL